jgi:alkaline phosphatase D
MSEAAAKAEKAAGKESVTVTQAQLRDIVLKADWRSQIPTGRTLNDMHGTLAGANGSVRVILGSATAARPKPRDDGDPRKDHTRQFTIGSLKPGTTYRIQVESRDERGAPGATVNGQFHTAPAATVSAPVKFGVVTCGDYPRRDDPANGHQIYDTLHRMQLDFIVHTGDVEYYDKPDPWATSAELARVKWNRFACRSADLPQPHARLLYQRRSRHPEE